MSAQFQRNAASVSNPDSILQFLGQQQSKNDARPAQPDLPPEIQQAHQQACERKEAMYQDPKTGYMVMTEVFLKDRGYCCKSGCRHCPFGFKK